MPVTARFPHAHLYLSALVILSVIAFWPGYFSDLRAQSLASHFHGVTAMAWMLMMIAQTWLAHRRQFDLHRALGKGVYVLAPLFVLSGLGVVYTMVANTESVFYQTWGKRLAFYDSTTTVFFAVAVSLAITFKKQTPIHARWMLATAFPLIAPVVTRLRFLFAGWGEGFSIRLLTGVTIAAAILAYLAVRDWRQGMKHSPFLWALVFTVLQYLVSVRADTLDWWVSATEAFATLPLEWLQ